MVEEVLLQQNLPALAPEEQVLMNLADEKMQHQVPLLPVMPVNVLDEEIP